MTPCKFQTQASGDYPPEVLIYDETEAIFHIAKGAHAEAIIGALDLPRTLGKVFALASVTPDGVIEIGDKLPQQDW